MKKTMCLLLLCAAMSCHRTDIDPDISPNEIEQFEYGFYFGFAGSITRLYVTQVETKVQLGYNNPKYCVTSTNPQDWQELVRLANIGEFKAYKSVTNIGCCDRNGEGITLRGKGRTYAVDNEVLARDSTSIGKLAIRLNRQMHERAAICK